MKTSNLPMRSSSDSAPVIMWFREDLRLADNPALRAAIATGRPLLCIYVYDQQSEGLRPLGAAARWWLHGSLAALQEMLRVLGGELFIVRGAAGQAIDALATAVDAHGVYWNRRYDEAGRRIDSQIKKALKSRGLSAESFNGNLLREPWEIAPRAGGAYSVFTAYWRAALATGAPPAPMGPPTKISFAGQAMETVALQDLELEPKSPDWARGFHAHWRRGEAGAQSRLGEFLAEGLANYSDERDRPDRRSTSRLSPHLRFGEISPRQIWSAVAMCSADDPALSRQSEKFMSELGWREFSYHVLFHRPSLARQNMREQFDAMPWSDDVHALKAWQQGQTGYPIVDAGMRELWSTGWMHNRVRMIVASFLTKHLLIDWRHGETWFWDTLVDADPANNATGWQWVAGSGIDAAPFFRIFNPVLQGQKFDPEGDYVKRWVPELRAASPSDIHKPWARGDAPPGYPMPLIDHDAARARALAAWRSLRGE